MTVRLLTESEAAERLRCPASRITRLRKTGQLTYIPGRPVLIDQADLDAYVALVKVPAVIERSRDEIDEERGRAREHARKRLAAFRRGASPTGSP